MRTMIILLSFQHSYKSLRMEILSQVSRVKQVGQTATVI